MWPNFLASRPALAAFWARTERYRSLGWNRFVATEFVAGWLAPTQRPVLDVGTGQGLLATALARRGFRVLTGDVSLETHAVAAELVRAFAVTQRVRFLLCDGSRLPFPDASFDRIAMMNVLHHLQDFRAMAAEFSRLAAPGCQLVLSDFSPDGFELVARVHREGGGEHPRTGVTLDSAVSELTTAGWHLQRRDTQHLEDVASFYYGCSTPRSEASPLLTPGTTC